MNLGRVMFGLGVALACIGLSTPGLRGLGGPGAADTPAFTTPEQPPMRDCYPTAPVGRATVRGGRWANRRRDEGARPAQRSRHATPARAVRRSSFRIHRPDRGHLFRDRRQGDLPLRLVSGSQPIVARVRDPGADSPRRRGCRQPDDPALPRFRDYRPGAGRARRPHRLRPGGRGAGAQQRRGTGAPEHGTDERYGRVPHRPAAARPIRADGNVQSALSGRPDGRGHATAAAGSHLLPQCALQDRGAADCPGPWADSIGD